MISSGTQRFTRDKRDIERDTKLCFTINVQHKPKILKLKFFLYINLTKVDPHPNPALLPTAEIFGVVCEEKRLD